jgi:hypothetical protein
MQVEVLVLIYQNTRRHVPERYEINMQTIHKLYKILCSCGCMSSVIWCRVFWESYLEGGGSRFLLLNADNYQPTWHRNTEESDLLVKKILVSHLRKLQETNSDDKKNTNSHLICYIFMTFHFSTFQSVPCINTLSWQHSNSVRRDSIAILTVYAVPENGKVTLGTYMPFHT